MGDERENSNEEARGNKVNYRRVEERRERGRVNGGERWRGMAMKGSDTDGGGGVTSVIFILTRGHDANQSNVT